MSDPVRVECIAEFIDKESNSRRKPMSRGVDSDKWYTSQDRAEGLERMGFVRRVDEDGFPMDGQFVWGQPRSDRWLETAPLPHFPWKRVVACLNIWNDLPALLETWDSWYPYVDHVIAVDGAYSGAPVRNAASDDGTLSFLEEFPNVTIVRAPRKGFWKDQVEKRNRYFEEAKDTDLLFVVDADEIVEGAECLKDLPAFEVGWVSYKKGIYKKHQNFPRLFSASIHPRYHDRHYWLSGDRGFITDCQYGGSGYDHAFIPLSIDNQTARKCRPEERSRAFRLIRTVQYEREKDVGDDLPGGREALRIVQLTSIDPGMVVFRLHSAINSTSPHESVMASIMHGRDFQAPYQFGGTRDRERMRSAVRKCDIIHCHLDYQNFDRLAVPVACPLVIHHHGTMYRENVEKCNRRDALVGSVRLVSNPELLQYGDNLHFLPNPVPCVRYNNLRKFLYEPNEEVLRVGHSPSKREHKGTEELLAAIENLQDKGLAIECVLIEGVSHEESLRQKASFCDVFFDSFWLSAIQCSGLEAGAMGIPTIGGDPDVKAFFGDDTPYIYANSGEELEEVLEQLYHEQGFLEESAETFQNYVFENHDYAAVTKRYLDILDDELGWREELTLGGAKFLRAKVHDV